MSDNRFDVLHELLHGISSAENSDELEKVVTDYAEKLKIYDDETTKCLVNDVRSIADKLICYEKQSASTRNVDKLSTFTELERAELMETNRVIDENLFDYHFQPIVSAVDGKIFSYEALMRPKSELCPSPFHILKYAEFADRLDDVERATFLNILSIVENRKDELSGRFVFINSIPKTNLSVEDTQRINSLLEINSEKVVVEMTEQSELGEQEFMKIKDTYNRLNVKIAVDDYGTGYSNVKNLLEYMPSFVKIDRSLINNIQNDRKKRHFVREIIEFCHDNKIMSLAEGVETSEELRTVIRLGVDLIQGFYTSRPSAVIIDKIPYEIRQEIKLYHQEREDGKDIHIYTAENNERIILDRLAKDDYSCVLIGKDGGGEIKLVGTVGVDHNISVEIAKGFEGKIIIDNMSLINENSMPCITLGENCEVRLEFIGKNNLRKGGIKVPESSKLVCCGQGNLYVYVDGIGFYGIGNDENSKHGEIVFEQGVSIDNNAAAGVCIGSGLGGKISARGGKFDLRMTGNYGVAIGTFSNDADIDMFASDISIDMSVQRAVGIGTLNGKCKASFQNAFVSLTSMGVDVVGIGTIEGDLCDVKICEAKAVINMIGDRCTAIGAIDGRTEFTLDRAGADITSQGDKALALGGFTTDTFINLHHADTYLKLLSQFDCKDYFIRENIQISGGRTRFFFNEQQITDQ